MTAVRRRSRATRQLEFVADMQKTLVLGLGNVILGDEGVGVHVVRALEKRTLPEGVVCLDGGTGGFVLLEPLQQAERVVLIDASADGQAIGSVTRTTPQFASDYPPTLTAHDIGVKDLLDALYMQSGRREITLYTITIDPNQPVSMELSELGAVGARKAVEEIVKELAALSAAPL
jgi:hydrogenase maturation protease